MKQGGRILRSLRMLAGLLGNVMPNACNQPRRPRYALSMTALKRVIAARATKMKERSRPVIGQRRPVHFRGASLRAERIRYIESYPRCIDVPGNKISLVYARAVTSSADSSSGSSRRDAGTMHRPRSITLSPPCKP